MYVRTDERYIAMHGDTVFQRQQCSWMNVELLIIIEPIVKLGRTHRCPFNLLFGHRPLGQLEKLPIYIYIYIYIYRDVGVTLECWMHRWKHNRLAMATSADVSAYDRVISCTIRTA